MPRHPKASRTHAGHDAPPTSINATTAAVAVEVTTVMKRPGVRLGSPTTRRVASMALSYQRRALDTGTSRAPVPSLEAATGAMQDSAIAKWWVRALVVLSVLAFAACPKGTPA